MPSKLPRLRCAVMLGLALSPLAIASAQTQRLTLDSAIEQALSSASKVLKSENAEESAGLQLVLSHARYRPAVNLNAGITSYNGSSTTAALTLNKLETQSMSANLGVSATMNVFNGFADQAGVSVAQARKRAASFSLEQARQHVAIDVTQSYLQVILDQKIEEIARQNLKISQDALQLIEAQRRAGAVPSADVYRQQAQVASDKLFLTRASDRVKVDKALLLHKIRADQTREYSLEEPNIQIPGVGTSVPTFDSLYRTAMAKRKDLQAAQSQQIAARHDIAVARGALLPKIDFQAGFAGAGTQFDRHRANGSDVNVSAQAPLSEQLTKQTVLTLGVVMSWPIYDRGIGDTNMQLARIAERNAQIDKRDVENQIAVDVKQALLEYGTALEALESTKTGVDAAEKAHEVIEGRYRNGSASYLELSVAQGALTQARSARAQAIVAFRLKKDVLAYASGQMQVASSLTIDSQ